VNALRLAFGLLTALPVRRLPRVDRSAAGWAITLSPLVVAPVLVVLAAARAAVDHAAGSALVWSVVVVGAGALLTRGLHLDGLADTADGLSATGDRAARLAAMKASDIGPSGVAVLVLALLGQVAALATLLGSDAGAGLAGLGWVASRVALSWGCRRGVPAAGSGLGATVAGTVPTWRAVATTVVTAAVGAWVEPLVGPAAVVAAVLVAVGLVERSRRRFGGITGDVLGASVEGALTGALLVAAVLV
jgi:adenosylcobinamide-GDP ribazoletransferase